MPKKIIFAILAFVAVSAAIFFFWRTNGVANYVFVNKNPSAVPEDEKTKPEPSGKTFYIAGWLPYWAKAAGASSLEDKLNIFSEINPFAFGVNSDGSLRDTAQIDAAPWPKLTAEAKNEKVAIVPTILWGDAEAMHKVFADSKLMAGHVDAIAAMLAKNGFSGVDIDYEGKDIADRDNFSAFIKALHARLASSGKTLSCTVEARSQDSPLAGFSGVRAMSWANDFSVLNGSCNSVRIMAYDEVFQVHRAQTFDDPGETPFAPNADIRWVGDVMRYALKYIAPEKLVLGVPTYGWEFKLTKLAAGYRYTRFKSVSYGEALEKARAAGAVPTRDAGGELSFVYKTSDGQHFVTFSDAQAAGQKIDLAKSLHLKGISLFKIDGLTDPQLFGALEKAIE
jgi:spore germination protein